MAEEARSTNSDIETQAGILRVAIPLMAKHRVPATPQNYAIWYHYVAEDKGELKKRIDEMLQEGEQFDTQVSDEIYQEHLADYNLQQVENIRQDLQATLTETSANLAQSGSDAEQFGNLLGRFGESCDSAESISEVYGMVSEVIQETQQMREAMQRMKQEFEHKSSELEELKEELIEVRKQASTDALTGLTNRATYFKVLESALENQQPDSAPMCVAMMDIDHFKRVNDTFGHLVGDKVIRFVAENLKQSLKGQDVSARYGGEEFALFLPNTELNNAVTLCDKIRESIATTKLVRSGSRESLGTITVSAGVAQFKQGEDVSELLQRADNALYHSKEHGRNQVTAAEN